MANKVLVDHLIANCDCWDESDRETLNKLSDAKLEKLKVKADADAQAQAVVNAAQEGYGTLFEGQQLTVNAMPEFIKKAIAKKKKKEGDEEDEEMEENDKGKKKKPAMNESRLTAEEQEDLAFARNERNRQRQDLIDQLTANVAAGDKPRVVNRLKDKSLDELRDLLALTPPQAEPAYSQPSYYGAAVPATNASYSDKNDVLPDPDYGW